MKKVIFCLLSALALIAFQNGHAQAQEPRPANEGLQATRPVTRVAVIGDSIVRAQPDTAVLVISVVTQNANALEAQQENARQ